MEEKINIAEILKYKPQGTKLYSRICGAVELKKVIDVRKKKSIVVKELNSNNQHRFWYDGNFFRAGQCVLQPSENMADWSKFSWKKGDVLVSNDGKCKVIFERFDDDTYTSFVGKYYVECYGKNDELQDYEEEHYGDTVNYTKESEEAAQTYINTIEERLGGKLNHETLEIENAQPEFKDGDVVALDTRYIDSDDVIVESFIIRGDYKYGDDLKYYAGCSNNTETDVVYNSSIMINKTSVRKESLRLATEEEKQQLFSALEKEGKAWDSEKKQIVDLKPKVEFKPMDLCLMKYIGQYNNRGWELCQYAYTEHRVSSSGEQRDFYHAVGGEIYAECIPYNEDTKHLLGTRDKWKGGEG